MLAVKPKVLVLVEGGVAAVEINPKDSVDVVMLDIDQINSGENGIEAFTEEWQDAFPEEACYLGLREYGN